jgi:8-oxo-dGTP pyrophosphatase MutT (NUDIX family)
MILNQTMTEVLVVQTYDYKDYGFPKGKLDEGETGKDCAVRELVEEIGFDISEYLNDAEYITIETQPKTRVTLYIITGIPNQTRFKTNTRKEIGRIDWMSLKNLRSQLIEENYDKKKTNLRKFLFLLSKWVDTKKSGLPFDEEFRKILVTDRTMIGRQKVKFFDSAKEAHFKNGNYLDAFEKYHNAACVCDNAKKSLEMMMHISLEYGDKV